MRCERTPETKLKLISGRRPKFCAKLSILIKDPIKINSRFYNFVNELTEEMMSIFHRHTAKSFLTVDSDGPYQTSKHEEVCYKNGSY